MKKIIFPLLVLLMAGILPSCSEKFNTAAPYKSITVVYGLLDQADTAHYIRIQKAFLDDNKSAVTMAKEVDSNFYANLTVTIKRVFPFDTTKVKDVITLSRVDLTTEGYPKQAGVFFNSPSYAYKFTNSLDSSLIYRLIITNNATGQVDSASTPVISDKSGNSFRITLVDDTSANKGMLSFGTTNPGTTIKFLNGYYRPPANFSFNGSTNPVAIVQGIIRVNWADSNTSTGGLTYRYYDFDLGTTSLDFDNSFKYLPKSVDLINAINNGMGAAPPNIIRLIDRFDLTFYLGTADFNAYIQAQQLQGLGLTGNEIQPIYTNIRGRTNQTIGLYTARGKRSGKVTVDPETVKFLIENSVTTKARIKGTVYH